MVYSESSKVENTSGTYLIEANHHSTLSIYTSPIVNVDGVGPIVVKRPSDIADTMLPVENSYLKLPNSPTDFPYASLGSNDLFSEGLYRHIVVTLGEAAAQGRNEYTGGFIRLESSRTDIPLQINILNFMRNIDEGGIKIYGSHNGVSESGPTEEDLIAAIDDDDDIPAELTSVIMGLFEDSNGVVDHTSVKLYVYVKYEAPSDDQSEFEPAILQIPTGFKASEGMRFDMTGLMELTPTADPTALANPDYYKIWEITLSLDQETATDGTKPGNVVVYNQSGSSDVVSRISAALDTTVMTGMKSIIKTEDGFRSIEFEFDSAATITKYIYLNITTHAAFEGYNGIKYDYSKLALTLESEFNGIAISTEPIRNGDAYVPIQITPSQLDKELNGDAIYLKFVDNTNGISKEIPDVRVLLTTRTVVYDIDLEEAEYSVVTNGKDGVYQETPITVLYNHGGVPPSSTDGVAVKIAVQKEDGTFSFVESASIDYNIDIKKEELQGSGEKKTYKYTLRVKDSMLSSDSTQYYVYAYYESDESIFAYAPIRITTTALDIALSDTVTDNIAGSVATLNFKTTEQTYDLSAKIINKGTSVDNDGSHTITYALFSDSDRRNPLGEGIASIENGIFKLLQPREASGTIYYRASFEDSESGKTRTLDLTINYTTSISKVSLTGIDEHTYTENESPDYAGTITLYYVSATAYTKLDLAGHISVLTAFDIAPTDYTVRFTADNGNLINGAIFGGSSKVIIPLSAGSTPLTITVTDDTETVVSIKVLLNIVELQSATLGESQGRIELFRNEQKSVTASLADDYSVFKPSFDISGDSRIIASKSDGSNSATFTLSLDRNKFKSDTDSDDTPYYLTVTMTYLYKDELSMSADIVGSLATTVTYTLTVYKDFGKLDFNLYENDSLVAANSSININSSATYKLKFDVPQDSWFVDGDWTFTAESLQTNVATLLNGGVFVSGAVTVLPSTTGAGAVTFNFTARGYGAVLTCSKSYTFTVPGNVSVTITPKINGVSQSALTFGDQETSKTIEIDFDGENAAEFTYSVTVTGAGTASSGCEIDFVGDATADSVSHADGTDVYTRTFKVTRPTTLILSSAVKLNGVTFYSKKYTLVLTATAPDFTVKSASDAEKVNPAETLKLSVENSAEKFKGEYTVSYSIVQSETGVTLGSPDGHDNWAVTLTAPEKNVKDKLVTVRAKVDVTSGAYKLTTYYVDKTITVVGIPLPTIDWKNGITVLGPSAVTAPGKMIDLSTYVNFNSQVNDSYGESYTYTGEIYAYSVSSTSLTSGFDYTLTSDGKLNILQSNNTKKGGKITIEVTATLGAGANKGSTVSATLVVVIMPELTTSAPKFVSGKPGTYTLGTLAYPANSTENGTDYSVKYSLVNSGDGAYFTLFGDRITVEQPVKEVKTVPVKVDIVITSGEYAGTAFTTNIDVTVLGTKLNESGSATISWTAGEDSNEYSYVTASSLVDMNTLTGWSISTISVSTDSTSFTRFRNNGQIEAAFSVNKDFNIRAVGSSDAATLTVYYDIVLTGTASESPVHCYGEGTITVEAISPELTVEIDGVNNSEIQPSVSIPGGQSFIVNYTEKHGLTLSGIDISDLGSALSYTVSGSSIQFTASSVALDQPMNVVTVTLKYNGKNSEVTVDKKINITVTATVLSAFDVTNTSIEVLYLNSGSSNTYYNVYSVWTASATNDSKHPVQLDIRSSTYLYNLFDNSNSASSKITVYMFDNQGVMQGSKEYQTSRLANNVTSITLDLSETAASEIQRLVLVMQFKRTMSTSATLTVNYYTTSDGGRSTDNYTQKSYTIRRISNGTVPVTFDANGGTIAGRPTTTVSGNAGATLHAPAADPVREGYRFEGWYPFTNPNATVDSDIIENTDFSVLRANDTFTIVFNTTYYAAWSIVPTTVTLDPDGGQISGVMGTKEIQVHFGEAYGGQLPTASAMSKTGYTFAGWYLEENLEAPVRITSSTIVTKSTAHTLKAHWTPKTYRVTLVDSHGKAEITSITVTFGGDFTGLPEGLTDTGYTFKGWYDKPNPEESDNAVTSSTQINSELLDNYALYAVWEAVKFNVSFNRNGGDGSSDPSPKTGVEYGSVYGELPTVSRAGYTFDGWTKTINGSDYIYAWSKVTETAGFTLYAHWTANTVTVSFDRNGGDGEADPISKTVERGSVYGQLPTVTRTGYEFKGWTKTLDSDDFVNAWDTVDSEITLHASWTAKEYTVTLVNIYGNPAVTFIKVKFNEKFTTLSDPAAVTGYEFKGWYDNANYGGTAVTNQTDVTDLADGYTLYAKWEAKKITVNFVTNDGVGTAQAKDVYYGGTYGTLPTLTKEGHTFDGWTKTNGGIDFVYDSSKVEETADTVTLYAKFTPKTYTVILVDSHGKAQVTSVTVTFGGSFDGLPEELEDDGYTFDGWYTSLEEGGQKVDGETPVTNLDEGYTLYAKWTANSPEEAGGADNQSDPQS
ncbi:MAG: InlB B-repeat-containing protein [Clostridiales bacterium]|nr:InlB B-repeat-containing protein [Clostridiales bacterium]